MMDYEGRSMKNQMKQADKQNALFVLILGERELENNEVALKDMHSGEQEHLKLSSVFSDWAADIKEKIKS